MRLTFYSVALSLLVIVGFILRIYHIEEIPPGFFADEAVRGIDAYLLKSFRN